MSFLYFLILIGVLIFVHELGHFAVAKFFGVGVSKFSIGFGPSLLSYQGKETEYSICLLPLGGFVLMEGADLESTEAMPEEDRHKALMAKPIWQRSLVVLAGPVANLILPVVIFFIFAVMQTTALPSQIGEVYPDTPAEHAGLMAGDRLVSINGKPVTFWHDTVRTIHGSPGEEIELQFERDGEVQTINVVPEAVTSTDYLGLARTTIGRIGIGVGAAGTVVGIEDRQGPAAEAGLQFFDQVVAINGEPVERFDEIKSAVRTSEGRPLEFVVLRKSAFNLEYAGLYSQHKETFTITPRKVDGVYRIGVDSSRMYLVDVTEGGAADRAGLKAGDKILAIDGRPQGSISLVTERIRNEVNERVVARDVDDDIDDDAPIDPSFELTVQRGDETLTIHYVPEVVAFQDDTEQTHYRVVHGWETFRGNVSPERIYHPLGKRIVYSAREGVDQTWEVTKMMGVALVRLAQGRLSSKSIGGPIMIGELAADAGRAGIEPFLEMMALISINLAIINMLPIPILDGGRLLFFALEAIKRGPLSYRVRQIAAYIGLVLIILLMVLAFKNDIERNWYRVVEYFEER